MLHFVFQGYQLVILEKQVSLRFLPYMGGQLGHVTWTQIYILSFPNPMKAQHEIWLELTK